MTLTEILQMLVAFANGLGLGKLLERRQNSADDNLKFLQAEISQANKEWRSDLKAEIAANHAEVMAELSAIKKGIGRGNRLIETGNHRGNDVNR